MLFQNTLGLLSIIQYNCSILGGGGQRRLVVIPPDLHGYTGQQLKEVSGNGKYTMYISPLQEELDTIPLPPEAKEVENTPKAQCTTCQKMVPLQMLPVHIKEYKKELVDLCYSAEEVCPHEHRNLPQRLKRLLCS